MAFKLNRSRNEPMSEINVTPFVDVMLVLLIIFMVTAPLLTVGVQVDLPESAADSLPDDQEPLTISINSKGEIYIQEHQVTYQKMVPKLLAIAKNRTDTRIYVRGDKNINYGRVLEVMGTLSGAGFSKSCLDFRTVQKLGMIYGKKFILFNHISLCNDNINNFKSSIYAKRTN